MTYFLSFIELFALILILYPLVGAYIDFSNIMLERLSLPCLSVRVSVYFGMIILQSLFGNIRNDDF